MAEYPFTPMGPVELDPFICDSHERCLMIAPENEVPGAGAAGPAYSMLTLQEEPPLGMKMEFTDPSMLVISTEIANERGGRPGCLSKEAGTGSIKPLHRIE